MGRCPIRLHSAAVLASDVSGENEMLKGHIMQDIKSILVAVDLSEGSEKVAEVAAGFAKAFAAKLYFLHVVRDNPLILGDPDVPVERDAAAQEIRDENLELQALRDKVTPPGVEAIALQIRGHANEKILSETVKLNIDLLVIGANQDRVRHVLMGDVVKDTLRHAPCPVVVVPSSG